jgi:hypothetical protein
LATFKSDNVAVTAPSTVVLFAEPMSDTNYAVIFRCYNPLTMATIPCKVDPANYTVNGFTAEPVAAGNIQYIVADYGTGVSTAVPGSLMLVNTVSVSAPSTVVPLGRTLSSAAYVVLFRCYDPDTLATVGCDIDPDEQTTSSFVAKVSESATLEYVVCLSIDGVVPLSRSWDARRMWAEAIRDKGLSGLAVDHFERYMLIQRAVNTVADALYPLLATRYMTEQIVAVSGEKIDLSPYKIMPGGPEARLSFESTTATTIVPMSKEELFRFRTSAHQNKNTIAWALAGDSIYVKKGASLASYGDLTLQYPRVPVEATTDATLLDLPDGAVMEAALLKLKAILGERYGGRVDSRAEMESLVQKAYTKLGAQTTLEEVREKVAKIL